MRCYKGFTLIELLIVIAIIAVLITILAPALQVAKEQATGAVCLGNMKILIQAWNDYADDNRELIVGGDTCGVPGGSYGPNGLIESYFGNRVHYDWVDRPQDVNRNYLGNATTYQDRIRGIQAGNLWKYINNQDAYHCPGDDRKFEAVGNNNGYRSYSVQGLLNGHDYFSDYCGAMQIRKRPSVKFPEEKYVFVEESCKTHPYNPRVWAIDPWGLAPSPLGIWDPLAVFHNAKSTLNYADNHAEIHKWQCDEIIDQFDAGTPYIRCNQHGRDCPDVVFLWNGVAHNGPM